MADKLKKASKAHTRYYLQDGTLVPGATTVTGLLNKPALVKWANNLGLQGIDSSKYVDKAARVGTLIHSLVEAHITGKKADLSDYTDLEKEMAEVGFKKYLDWEKQHKVEPIFNEKGLENNIGLYIYGDNSSGKTFLLACICNELVWKGYSCIYTNLASILNEIRASYDKNGMGECAILNHLQYYNFAFIDDLGKEFLGREYNAASSKWAEEKFFEVLNARYNAQKPTIFSSNYSISELASVLGLDKAIIERINEMATRVIKLEGDDFRSIVRDEKSDIAKKLGI